MASSVTAIKKKPAQPAKNDKFAIYASVVTVLVLLGALGYYAMVQFSKPEDKSPNYAQLPQYINEVNGSVIQLQVAIQVDPKDKEWLVKNQKAINEIFKKSMSEVDPAVFRTKGGAETVQNQLRDEINQSLKTDKVKAVLYNDLITQYKADE